MIYKKGIYKFMFVILLSLVIKNYASSENMLSVNSLKEEKAIQTRELHNNLSFKVRYPIPIGQNFLNHPFDLDRGYIGLADLGITYNFNIIAGFYIGVGLNAGYLYLDFTKINCIILNPLVNIEYKADLSERVSLTPMFSIGYSSLHFKSAEYTDHGDHDNGFTLSESLKICRQITERFSMGLTFGHTFTKVDSKDVLKTRFNTTTHILCPGISFSFKL